MNQKVVIRFYFLDEMYFDISYFFYFHILAMINERFLDDKWLGQTGKFSVCFFFFVN